MERWDRTGESTADRSASVPAQLWPEGLVGATETLAALAASLSARASGRALEQPVSDAIDTLMEAIGAGSLQALAPERAEILAASARSALALAADFAANPYKPAGWHHEDPSLLADQ